MKIKLFSRQRAACRTPTLGGGGMEDVRIEKQNTSLYFGRVVFLFFDTHVLPESGRMAGHTTCCREWTAERSLKAERLTHRLFWPPSYCR